MLYFLMAVAGRRQEAEEKPTGFMHHMGENISQQGNPA